MFPFVAPIRIYITKKKTWFKFWWTTYDKDVIVPIDWLICLIFKIIVSVCDISVDMAALGRSRLLTFFSHQESTTLLMPVQLCRVERTSINVLVMFVIYANISWCSTNPWHSQFCWMKENIGFFDNFLSMFLSHKWMLSVIVAGNGALTKKYSGFHITCIFPNRWRVATIFMN